MRSCYGTIIRRTAHHRIRTRARVPHSSEGQVIHPNTACDTTTYIHTSKNGKIYMHVMCILIPWKSGPHRDTFPTWFSGLRANIIHLKLDYKRHIYFILAYIHRYKSWLFQHKIHGRVVDDRGRLPAELQHIRGEVLRGGPGYYLTHPGAAREEYRLPPPICMYVQYVYAGKYIYVCMYGVGRGRNANTDRWLSKEEVTEASPVKVKRSERNR